MPTVTEICWFRIVDLGFVTGDPVAGEMSHLMPEGLLDMGEIGTESLFAWSERCAREALDAFDGLIEDTRRLVEAVGELAPVNEVYRAPGLPGIHTERPEPAGREG
jgi:hypothetical protein